MNDLAAYHCQQAAEKLMKAALIRHGIKPERTHDLGRLAARLRLVEPRMAAAADAVAPLTAWSVVTRYPDQEDIEPVTAGDIAAAIDAVEALRVAIDVP